MTIREWVRVVVSLGCGFTALAVAQRAQAKSLAGSGRIQLKTEVVDYQSSDDTSRATNPPPGGPELGPISLQRSNTSFGLMGAGYGAEMGYFVSDHFELAAGLLLSHGHSSGVGMGSSDATSISLMPRLEYAFGGGRLRPYVAVFGGYQHSWSSNESAFFVSNSDSSGFVFGAGLGAHLFVGDSWSLDPEIALRRSSQSGTISTTGVADTADTTSGYDETSRATALVLSIGLSGWFGGH
jgi:Outer membrane protein beta-barrel domain